MRRIFMVGVSAVASILLMAGCNKQVIDLTYEYSQRNFKLFTSPCGGEVLPYLNSFVLQ